MRWSSRCRRSAARNPQWSLGITVSRRILFYSVALFGAAAYLLAMAAAGYYLRFFGGSWGTVMQVSFLFGAIILLIGGAFLGQHCAPGSGSSSASTSSATTMTIGKNGCTLPAPCRKASHGLGERVIQALAQLGREPGGSLWIRQDSGNFEPVAQWNMPVRAGWSQRRAAFCQFLEHRSG